jgi:hypothetical protein
MIILHGRLVQFKHLYYTAYISVNVKSLMRITWVTSIQRAIVYWPPDIENNEFVLEYTSHVAIS